MATSSSGPQYSNNSEQGNEAQYQYHADKNTVEESLLQNAPKEHAEVEPLGKA
jgi:hypothetical protein